MAKVKIVIDSSADMPEDILKKYDMGLVHFMSVFGEKAYVAGVDITKDEFFSMLEESDKIPTTSQTAFADMYDYFVEQIKNNDTVVYFTISSKASGQNHTAHLVREEIMEEYPNADFRIVDSMTFSLYIANAAVEAAKAINDGKSVEEAIEIFHKEIERWDCYLLVDTLKYLEKGGRISKATAIVGNLLDIKPIIHVEDGLVASFDKLRGKKKLIDKLIERVTEEEGFNSENPEFLVLASDVDKLDEVCEKLTDEFGDNCIRMKEQFGPIIGTHVGPGAFAIIAKNTK